jgi:hypothetical protein
MHGKPRRRLGVADPVSAVAWWYDAGSSLESIPTGRIPLHNGYARY